jgi:pimeloyl-ACP methyl ester carboxylesterase
MENGFHLSEPIRQSSGPQLGGPAPVRRLTVLPHDQRGSGEAVVLLHAGVADRTMWREHLELLAGAGYQGIALDLPGFGEAAPAPGPQAPWDDVLRTMRELELGPAAVVGNSFGAAIALRAAIVAPAAVRSLMLVSPPPLDDEDPSPALRAAWEAEEDALERGDVEAAVEAVLEAWLQPDAPPDLRDRVAAMQRRSFELQATAPDVSEAPDPLEQDPDALSNLRVPVLTVAGEVDMPDFKRAAEDIAATVTGARSEIIEGAGHLAPLEAPDRFWDSLRRFLDAGP